MLNTLCILYLSRPAICGRERWKPHFFCHCEPASCPANCGMAIYFYDEIASPAKNAGSQWLNNLSLRGLTMSTRGNLSTIRLLRRYAPRNDLQVVIVSPSGRGNPASCGSATCWIAMTHFSSMSTFSYWRDFSVFCRVRYCSTEQRYAVPQFAGLQLSRRKRGILRGWKYAAWDAATTYNFA